MAESYANLDNENPQGGKFDVKGYANEKFQSIVKLFNK